MRKAAQFDAGAASVLASMAPEPEPDHRWEPIWRAWWQLNAGDRPHHTEGIGAAMGAIMIRSAPGRLPWSAVQRYAEANGFPSDEADLLHHCVAEMDSIYLDHWRGKNSPNV